MLISLVWLGLMSYLELLMQQASSVISTEMVTVYFALLYVYSFFNIVEKY